MILKTFQNGSPINTYCEYVADTEEDVKKIKILPKGRSMGNQVYVIATKKTYVLDSKGVWHSRVVGDNSSIVCDCIEESTIWEELPE